MEKNKSAAEMVDRKEGYYWVLFNGDLTVGKYIISITKSYSWWYLTNKGLKVEENELDGVNELMICRS